MKTRLARKSARNESPTSASTCPISRPSAAWDRTVVRFEMVSAMTPVARECASEKSFSAATTRPMRRWRTPTNTATSAGHHKCDRPGHDAEDDDRPERRHRDPQDPPHHGVDQLDEGPRRGLQCGDDLARGPVGVPGMAEPDQVLVPVRDGATERTQRRAPVEPAADAAERPWRQPARGHSRRSEERSRASRHRGCPWWRCGPRATRRSAAPRRRWPACRARWRCRLLRTRRGRAASGAGSTPAVSLFDCIGEEGAVTHGSLQVCWSCSVWWSFCFVRVIVDSTAPVAGRLVAGAGRRWNASTCAPAPADEPLKRQNGQWVRRRTDSRLPAVSSKGGPRGPAASGRSARFEVSGRRQ